MPSPEPFISASCSITANTVFKNGQAVYEGPGLAAPDFLDGVYHYTGIAYPKFHKMDLLCKLGLLAAEILLTGNHEPEAFREDETGIVLSNAHGSLDVDLKYAKTMSAGASPALFVYTLPNIVIGEIAIRHRFKGENAFFVFNHFHGNFIAEYVKGLFADQLIRRCLCGWVDFLGETYDARLVLAESGSGGMHLPFTAENLLQLNNINHG